MDKKKPRILLDLDQTLISAEASDEFPYKKYKQKMKLFKFHNMEGYYIIFERPGLQEFLTYLFENFRVSIWTAASKDYALFIIEKIVLQDKTRRLDHIFFCNHCDVSKKFKKGRSKNLETIWDVFKLEEYNSDNSIILDDYDEVHETQPENCIIAHPFEFQKHSSHRDKFLSQLLTELPFVIKRYQNNGSVKRGVPEINSKLKK